MPLIWPYGFLSAQQDVPVTTITRVANSVSNANSTITLPNNIQKGDLIIVAEVLIGGISGSNPSGWSLLHSVGLSGFFSMRNYAKIAEGNEGGTTYTGQTSSSRRIAIVFRGNAPIANVIVKGQNQQVTTGNPSSQVVNTANANTPLLVIANYGSTGEISPRTFTPSPDAEISANTNAWFAYKIYNYGETPSNHTVDMDDEGTNGLMSYILEIQGTKLP